MKDSGRLTARETSELEHRLLEAARKARVPPEMTLRMSQGLGFGAKAAGASTGVGVGVGVGLKTGGLIVLGAVAIIGVAGSIGGWFGHGGRPNDGVAPATETVAAAPAVTAAPAIAVAPPVAPVAPTPRGANGVRRAQARGPAPRPTDGVREELAILEEARSALAGGAPDRALQLLARHDRRHPHGSFRPEATVLRVEALARRGDTEAARALATRFLAEHPDSPLAERVTRLVASGR